MRKIITIIFLCFPIFVFAQDNGFHGSYGLRQPSIEGDLGLDCTPYVRIYDIYNGGCHIIRAGVVWSTASDNQLIVDSGTAYQDEWYENITDDLNGLPYHDWLDGFIDNTRYYYRAFIETNYGIFYGARHQYLSAICSGNKPTVTTGNSSGITYNSTIVSGSVTDEGSSAVTSWGVCYNTIGTPSISDMIVNGDTPISSFTCTLTSLSPNTLYYARAFATNTQGTSYGSEIQFTTLSQQTNPTLTTIVPYNISSNSAYSGGTNVFDGNATVIEKGVCWSTSPNPTYNDSKTNDGYGTTDFISSITGLTTNTTYYVRAYARNRYNNGNFYVYAIGYGQQEVFTTMGTETKPVVTTSPISAITCLSATSGGNVTYDGGSAVTSRGVCWSITQNPTILNDYTQNGNGDGVFTSELSGLECNTTYYVRAYAINSIGVSYGDQLSFTTPSEDSVPILSTAPITAISYNSALSGGNISSVGSSAILDRGVCFATHQNPTLSDLYVSNGVGQLGGYSTLMEGLSQNTTYYVRSYATNSSGTGYGNQLSFTTSSNCVLPSFSSASCVNPTSYSIDVNATINSNSCGITSRGFQYSTDSQFNTVLGSVSVGSGSGYYSTTITGLSCGTHYYFRPWATSSAGTYYANSLIGSGCTVSSANLPVLALKDYLATQNCGSGNFTTSFDAACIALHKYNNDGYSCGTTSLLGAPHRTLGTVGSKIYVDQSQACVVDTAYVGYFLAVNPLSGNYEVYHIVNGIIQSITPCP